MEQKRVFGQIFLPDNPEQIQKGVWLNIKPNSIYLEVPLDSLSSQYWEIILGEFNGMDEVTFVNARTGGGSFGGAGGSWGRIYVSYFIKGTHIYSKDELKFNQLTLLSPALTNWVFEKEGIEKLPEGNFKIPDDKEIVSTTIESIQVTIILRYNGSYSWNSLTMYKEVIVFVKSEGEMELEEYFQLIRKIKRWILFVTNKNPEFSNYFLGKIDSYDLELINTFDDLKDERFAQNLTFDYSQLRSSLENFLKNWIVNEKLETIVDLLQEKQYNTDMSFKSYFLNMCVAIESFHSIFGDERANQKIEGRIKDRQLISEKIEDNELKERFLKSTESWTKSFYRERLKTFKPTLESIMGSTFSFSSSKLIDRIVKTRNALAHTGTHENTIKHIELLLIGKVLEFTLKYEILNLLGFESEDELTILDEAARHVKVLADLNKYS